MRKVWWNQGAVEPEWESVLLTVGYPSLHPLLHSWHYVPNLNAWWRSILFLFYSIYLLHSYPPLFLIYSLFDVLVFILFWVSKIWFGRARGMRYQATKISSISITLSLSSPLFTSLPPLFTLFCPLLCTLLWSSHSEPSLVLWKNFKFVVFDCPQADLLDEPYTTRYSSLKDIIPSGNKREREEGGRREERREGERELNVDRERSGEGEGIGSWINEYWHFFFFLCVWEDHNYVQLISYELCKSREQVEDVS